jgi:multidrug efflux pump subunit AcrA (membrane-fusion protein)
MYKSKDLTEETEEIILRRQRNYVEMIEYYLKEAEYERDVAIKTLLPRREQLLKDSAVKLGLDVHRARVLLPLTLNQKRLALHRMKYDHDKQTSRLAKLRHDRDAMTVAAPGDGLLYHGKCVRGQWQGSPDRLQPGAMLQGHEVLVTIVKSRPIFVRAVVDEKDLRHLRAGLTGKVVPSGFPDQRLPAKVVRVSPIPISSEKFDVHVSVDVGKDDLLVPGMSASVKVVPYLNQNALTVPSSAVFTDEIDDDQHYVYVPGKGGKAEKRSVTLGFKDGARQEIRSGLQEGEEILKEKPDDGAKASTTRGGKS